MRVLRRNEFITVVAILLVLILYMGRGLCGTGNAITSVEPMPVVYPPLPEPMPTPVYTPVYVPEQTPSCPRVQVEVSRPRTPLRTLLKFLFCPRCR